MATPVGVMDRDSRSASTESLVVVDARRSRLVWIPRDVWSELVGDRINRAFARGGHDLLRATMHEQGFSVGSTVVLLRPAVEHPLAGINVTVPVDRPCRYWYPLAPTLRLQDGRKLVRFFPPSEMVAGEWTHQWIGARRSADQDRRVLPDLDRVRPTLRLETFTRFRPEPADGKQVPRQRRRFTFADVGLRSARR